MPAPRTLAPAAARLTRSLGAGAFLVGVAASTGAAHEHVPDEAGGAAGVCAGPDSLPLHLFSYNRAAPLDLRDSVVRTEGGVALHAISFASPGGGRATGYLLVPAGPGPFAGVIQLHGMPGSAQRMIPSGMYVARHGAVVVVLDAPFSRREGEPLTGTVRDSAEQVQLVMDLQRAVDLLLARPDVDPQRLAFLGRSYGGAMGALFAGVERRLKMYVLAVADGGLVSHLTGPDDPAEPPGGMTEEEWRRWLAAMTPIEPLHLVHRATPASILFQSALRDELVPVADAERVQQAASEPKTIKWYDSGHTLPPSADVDQLEWRHHAVGTTPPGPADRAGPARWSGPASL